MYAETSGCMYAETLGCMYADFGCASMERQPLNINWQRLFQEVTDYGFKCRERKAV